MGISSRPHPRTEPVYDVPLTAAALEKVFSSCADFELRAVFPGGERGRRVSVCYIDGLVSGNEVSQNVLRPLTELSRLGGARSERELLELLRGGMVYSYSVKQRDTTDDAVADIVNGSCAVVFDRERKALTFECRTSERRSVSEPKIEKTIKGAKDAFVETLRTNTSLVRRKLRDPKLKVVNSVVGRRSNTTVAVMYMEGIANPELPAELLRRLDGIDTDGALSTGDIEEFVVDCPDSPFPQLIMTERSDKFSMDLLDGRVGFIIEGLPLGFLLPGTLPQLLHVPDDSSQHALVASAITLLRYLSLFMSLLLPAFFVAIAMYHQEMLPTKLLLSMIDAKQSVPFSVAGEVLAMLIAFELLQEAGVRLPDPIGETVGIIGALIVGQSAVAAKVVSPIAVIVVALAGVAGYTLPNRDLGSAIRLCRFALVAVAILAGIFGVIAGAVLIVYHLCCVESFGTPYTAPLTGGGLTGLLHSVFRPSLRRQKERDAQLRPTNIRKRR